MRSRWLILALALVAQAASALATIEFMKMGATEQYDVVKPMLVKFLQRGYKKVPDNPFTLIRAIEKITYAKGYTFQNIEDVALEAAESLGMIR